MSNNYGEVDLDDWEGSVMVMRSAGLSAQHSQYRRLLRDASRKAHLFNQDEVWVNGEGRYIPIREISARYAENIMHHLEGQAREDAEAVYLWNNRDHPADFELTDEECLGWLRTTPLYEELRRASERPF